MKRITRFLVIFISILLSVAQADDIVWTEVDSYDLPQGVKLFKGTRQIPLLQIFYLDVNLNEENLAIRPYLGDAELLPQFTESVGAYAAINGGFFGGNTSYSSVVTSAGVEAVNVASVTRNNQSYPLLRSFFGMDTLGGLSVDWIYHFDQTIDGLYRFDQPLDYAYNDPTPKTAPAKADGQIYNQILLGIGGAPTLVKDGQRMVTYNEEIMWGSGVGYDNSDPRTAVGYTVDKHVILMVADGRQSQVSEGVGLAELADIMIDRGCVEAMNLDGGGSTQMAVGNTYVNSPSENRAVPSILAVVHQDSLGLPEEPVLEDIIDTSDDRCQLIGEGWFPTANAGFWGETPSMLNEKGDGGSYAVFDLNVETPGTYDVFGWWVAANNRCSDTPFIIEHSAGRDTFRIDQTDNGSTWTAIGTFNFNGDTSEKVIITDAASQGTYVVADAIKLAMFDTSATAISESPVNTLPHQLSLRPNYPNPFNGQTKIEFVISADQSAVRTSLNIYNIMGQNVKTLLNGPVQPGRHTVRWDGTNREGQSMSTGVYFCVIRSGSLSKVRKLTLIR
ncbi:MAG: T9SS type A sorting domain-containing protein [Caldithrix sp.]|nr:T9SS type A sorting domain-containing protein [Caldithrix sp.]